MTGWLAGVAGFLSLPLAIGLIFFVTVPELRPRFYEAARNDWRRMTGRLRHPTVRQARTRESWTPWDGWAP